jgi:hypothetical protein
MDAARRLTEYFMGIIADRRGGSADSADVTTSIVNSEVELDGVTRQMTDQELGNLFHLLAIAGLHTTQGSLAWGSPTSPTARSSGSGCSTSRRCSRR